MSALAVGLGVTLGIAYLAVGFCVAYPAYYSRETDTNPGSDCGFRISVALVGLLWPFYLVLACGMYLFGSRL